MTCSPRPRSHIYVRRGSEGKEGRREGGLLVVRKSYVGVLFICHKKVCSWCVIDMSLVCSCWCVIGVIGLLLLVCHWCVVVVVAGTSQPSRRREM